MNIRVLTINTWKCDGDYGGRLKLMAKQLKELEPDVIALQESFRTVDGVYDTAEYLSSLLGMTAHNLSYRRKMRHVAAQYLDSFSGLAILTVGEVRAEHRLALPSVPEDGDRDGLLLKVVLNGAELNILNLHLSHLPAANELRVQQLRKAIELASDLADGPVVVCGDFNSPLALYEAAGLLSPEGVLVDCWSSCHGEKLHTPTVHIAQRECGMEFESGVLDHMLLLPNGQDVPVVSSASLALDRADPATGLLPSDHTGICVDLSLAIKL